MVVVPFGFSVGDFIALGKLVQDIFIALKNSDKATSEYRSVHAGLSSLSNSLQIILWVVHQVHHFVSSSSTTSLPSASCSPPSPLVATDVDQAVLNGIECELRWCKQLIEQFLAKHSDYLTTMSNQTTKKLKAAQKRILWSINSTDQIIKLQMELKPHIEALRFFTDIVELKLQNAMTERMESLGQSSKRIETSLERLNVATQRTVPDSLGYPWTTEDCANHVKLLDALGNTSFIPYEACTSKEEFHEFLNYMFRHRPERYKIHKLQYCVIGLMQTERSEEPKNEASQNPVQLPVPKKSSSLEIVNSYNWDTFVYPGAFIALNMVFSLPRDVETDSCPNCTKPNQIRNHAFTNKCVFCHQIYEIIPRSELQSTIPEAVSCLRVPQTASTATMNPQNFKRVVYVPESSEITPTQDSLSTKAFSFSPIVLSCETWNSSMLDRRNVPVTCNVLTSARAQQIREEINDFKLEMEVHEDSKVYTHFFKILRLDEYMI